MMVDGRANFLDVVERGEVLVESDEHIRILMALGSEFEERQFFTIRVKRGKYFLTAGKYVGVIPISRGLILRVAPKVSTSQLIHILRLAKESPLLINLLERSYAQGDDLSLLDLLIHALHRELGVLFQLGPIREYRSRTDTSESVRGRPLFEQTISKLWPKASFDRVTFDVHEFTPQNYLNQALEYTIWLVRRTYPSIAPNPSPHIMRDFADAHQMFTPVAPDRRRAFLPALRSHLREQITFEPFASLRPLLTLCRMILDGIGVDLESDPTDVVNLVPMVVNMEEVFQNLLFQTLSDRAPSFAGLQCWDTANQHQRPLLKPGTKVPPAMFLPKPSSQPAKPDLTFALNSIPALIGDAKYKSGQDIHDVYQAVSHAGAYGARDVLLIYPSTGVSEPIKFASLGRVGEIGVFTCSFPLDADDLGKEADTLVLAILELIEQRTAMPTVQ
ncbi:McrC family protein [Arthrobacter humicola]|uniref:McrC family protein n=1 Tax=Arthrobacter humicola TaxID=409291 RepID=UPI001FAD9459|nr:McrC family protein [Arthrobacter humicola]MCI9872739.1 hypothetical protein [Arthrobacter humicola]